MNRLLAIGFEPAGHWLLVDGQLTLELSRHAGARNVLYAFVCDGEVIYVGKTIQKLSQRMAGYRKPGPSQGTNKSNHGLLIDAGKKEIIIDGTPVMVDTQPSEGESATTSPLEATDSEIRADVVGRLFTFTLQPTYYKAGFFNVSVDWDSHIGADGEKIELYLGDADQPILGTINRRANTNGTARIMGGTYLRHWFQANAKPVDSIVVQVRSRTAINLKPQGTAAAN